jgi:hypothetical protein
MRSETQFVLPPGYCVIGPGYETVILIDGSVLTAESVDGHWRKCTINDRAVTEVEYVAAKLGRLSA